jgi:hypothetical protein
MDSDSTFSDDATAGHESPRVQFSRRILLVTMLVLGVLFASCRWWYAFENIDAQLKTLGY